jgi:hypothetical protein
METLTDGRTVWVNGPDGCCLGRFSRFGVDVHRTFAEQAAGLGQCLTCTHGIADNRDWRLFQAEMQGHHGVVVSDKYRPKWLKR